MTASKSLWYLIRTKARKESVARDNLERQGFQCYLPLAKIVKLSRGVQRQVIEPLFSGYLFVDRIDEAKSLTPVRSTIGVKNIVKFGDSIQPVHEDIITMLQSRETDAGFHELERPTLKVGERVQIESGPLAGIEAVFQAERGSDRAMILIEVLGSSRTVQISKITLSDPDR